MGPRTFATYVLWTAAIWGVLVIAPVYFIFDRIGVSDPPRKLMFVVAFFRLRRRTA